MDDDQLAAAAQLPRCEQRDVETFGNFRNRQQALFVLWFFRDREGLEEKGHRGEQDLVRLSLSGVLKPAGKFGVYHGPGVLALQRDASVYARSRCLVEHHFCDGCCKLRYRRWSGLTGRGMCQPRDGKLLICRVHSRVNLGRRRRMSTWMACDSPWNRNSISGRPEGSHLRTGSIMLRLSGGDSMKKALMVAAVLGMLVTLSEAGNRPSGPASLGSPQNGQWLLVYRYVVNIQEDFEGAPIYVTREGFDGQRFDTMELAYEGAAHVRQVGVALPTLDRFGRESNIMPESITPMPHLVATQMGIKAAR